MKTSIFAFWDIRSPERIVPLAKLLVAAERAAYARLLISGVAMPLAFTYFFARLGPEGGATLAGRAIGPLSLGLAAPTTQVGFACVRDRFLGRLSLVETSIGSLWTYVSARLMIGVIEAAVVIACCIAALRLGGVPLPITASAGLFAVLACCALSACVIAMVLGCTAKRLDSGLATTSIVTMLLAIANPALFSPTGIATANAGAWAVSPYAQFAAALQTSVSGRPIPLADAAWPLALAVAGLTALGFSIARLRGQR